MQEAFDGLVAASQNRWPSLRLDLMAVSDLLAPLIGAGFYYKTFMWPPSWERVYEPLIRRVAGLGGCRARRTRTRCEKALVLRPAGDRRRAGRADGGAGRRGGPGRG